MDVEYRPGIPPDFGRFLLTDVKYGNLTGDAREEAIVTLRTITSGSARPAYVFVYAIVNESPKRLWTYESGDRAHWGLHDARPQGGYLVIEIYKPDTANDKGKVFELPTSHQYRREYYVWAEKSFKRTKTEDDVPIDPNDPSPWTKN
jgi:hypothetical protein